MKGGPSLLSLIVNRAVGVLVALTVLVAGGSGSPPTIPARTVCPLPVSAEPSANEQAPTRCWTLIGNNGTHLAEEFEAGIRYKVFELDWASYNPAPGVVDAAYLRDKQVELTALRNVGFSVILSLGIQNPPRWIHDKYADSYYVNQYGDRYVDEVDGSDVNLVFNPELRILAANYIRDVFAGFGFDFAAVRLGGGRYGELTYPPAQYNGKPNCYWSFDRLAMARTPTPQWRPGIAARASEVRPFLDWYLDQLVDFQEWQIVATRAAGYSGHLMMLYPSWGVRPGDLELAIKGELMGLTSAEQNGEIQRGYDFARQIASLRDPEVIVTTTWLDADPSGDTRADAHYWSPVKYLSRLAHAHPLNLAVFGENTGEGSAPEMRLSGAQVAAYGLIGMAWLDESELFSGRYATLDDYRQTVTDYSPPW